MAALNIKESQVLIYRIMLELADTMTKEDLSEILEMEVSEVEKAIEPILSSENALIEIASNPEDGYLFVGTDADITKFENMVDEVKPEVKLEVKPEVKLEVKQEVKQEPKPETTQDSKSETKSEKPVINDAFSLMISRIARCFEKKRLIPESTVLSKSGLEKEVFYEAVLKMVDLDAIEIKEMEDYDEKVYKKTNATLSFIIENDDLSKIKPSSESSKDLEREREEAQSLDVFVRELVRSTLANSGPKAVSGISASVISENKAEIKAYSTKITKNMIEDVIAEMINDKALIKKGSANSKKFVLATSLVKEKKETPPASQKPLEAPVVADQKKADSTPPNSVSEAPKPVEASEKSLDSNETNSELVKALENQIEFLKAELLDTKNDLDKANTRISNVLKALS